MIYYKGQFTRIIVLHNCVNTGRHSHGRKASTKVVLPSLPETFGYATHTYGKAILLPPANEVAGRQRLHMYVSVILSTERGVHPSMHLGSEMCIPACIVCGVYVDRVVGMEDVARVCHPAAHDQRRPQKRVVRILPECVLVSLWSLANLKVNLDQFQNTKAALDMNRHNLRCTFYECQW